MNKFRTGAAGTFFLFLLLLVGSLIPAGCSNDGKPEEKAVPPAPAVREAPAPSAGKGEEIGVKLQQHALIYTVEGNGSIRGDLSQTVNPGESGSAVTAEPAVGHHFVQWSDGSTANPRTDVNVNADLAVSARFELNQYALAYDAGEHGSLTGPARQSVTHGNSGKPVTAIPADGFHFLAWSDGSTANPRLDSNITADRMVTADFATNQYTLVYSAGNGGFIAGAATQTIAHGGAGSTVTAKAGDNYHFAGWSDGIDTPDRTDANVSRDLAVTAVFEQNPYAVGGKVIGLAEGNEVVLKNGEEELAVSANGAFAFASARASGSHFSVAVKIQPTSPNQTCTVIGGTGTIAAADVTGIEVECRNNVYTVGGAMSGLVEGGEIVLQNNKGDNLLIRTNGQFVFPKALDDGSGYEVSILSQKNNAKRFCSVEKGKGALAGNNVTAVDVACSPEVELRAVPGLGKIDLSWNSQDFPGATFNLCRATENISPDGFDHCKKLKNGVLDNAISSPYPVFTLPLHGPFWYQLEVRHPGGRGSRSNVVTATSFAGVNDTGIDWCADNDRNRYAEGGGDEKTRSCELINETHPEQDGRRGRDAVARSRKLAKKGRGSHGFDYTKVCMSGEPAGVGNCPSNPSPGDGPNNWACTRDNVTTLMWEVKTPNGLRGQDNTYTWYDLNNAANGGAVGIQKGGTCQGSDCDTHAYVQTLNAKGLCGARDWRLPTRKELLSIVDNGVSPPAIGVDFFPNSPAADYWSATPYADQPNSAWCVSFDLGEVYPFEKGKGARVRLVRQAR